MRIYKSVYIVNVNNSYMCEVNKCELYNDIDFFHIFIIFKSLIITCSNNIVTQKHTYYHGLLVLVVVVSFSIYIYVYGNTIYIYLFTMYLQAS